MTTSAQSALFLEVATIVERIDDAQAFGARLADDPADVLAEARLETIYRNQSDWEALTSLLLDRADAASSDDERAAILAQVASIYQDDVGDPTSALLVALTGFGYAASSALADLLDNLAYQTGQWDEVIDAYMLAAGKTDCCELASELWLRIACAHLVTTGNMGIVSEALERVTTLPADNNRAYLDMVEGRIQTLEMVDTWVELARRIGDDDRRSRALSRAVAIASDLPTKARYQLAIGDLAEQRGDVETATWHYTEALRLDPGRAGAREALVTIYRARGDYRELAQILASSRFSAAQTEKAAVALEAASIYADELDENTRAINLYAFALSQDPEHVGAALPLAERYYAEKRWTELAPVLELLVNRYDELGPAAPNREELLFQSGECASERGNTEMACESFRAALAIDRTMTKAHLALAKVLTINGDHNGACNAYNSALVAQRNQGARSAERAKTLTSMARTRVSAGDDDAALTLYESSLDLCFEQTTFDELAAIYRKRGQWRELVTVSRCQLKRASKTEQVRLLTIIAEIAGSRLADPHGAIECYEQAHSIDTKNRSVLHQLIEYYGAAEMWEQAVHSMRKVAALETDSIRRGKYLQAAATIARHHLDIERTVELSNQALDCFFVETRRLPVKLRPGCLKVFTDLAKSLYSARQFRLLEKNYRQMIRRMRVGDAELPEMWHGLGQVYRKHLRKTNEAIESFEVASSLDADRLTHHRILVDLYSNSTIDEIDKSIARRRLLAEAEPFVSDHYRALRGLFARSHRIDEAWTATRALVFLGVADYAELDEYDSQKLPSGSIAQGPLSDSDWAQLRHPDEDSRITTILALVSTATALESATSARRLGLRDDSNPIFDHLRSLFAATTSALGLPNYNTCIQPEISGNVMLANVRKGRELTPTFVAGRSLYDGQSVDAIIYTLARMLTYGRREYLLRLALPNTADLESVFLAAATLSRGDVPVPCQMATRVAHYQVVLNRRLLPEWKEALAAAVGALTFEEKQSSIERWGYSVDATARRVGLLLSGDLQAAVSGLNREPRFTSRQPMDDKIADLIAHSVSATHHRLRAKFGLAQMHHQMPRFHTSS